jgi:hypothetical protein
MQLTKWAYRLQPNIFFVYRAIARMRNDRLSFSIRLFIPTLGLFVGLGL